MSIEWLLAKNKNNTETQKKVLQDTQKKGDISSVYKNMKKAFSRFLPRGLR